MPKVSIVIPIYNVEEYLPKCLDSVLAQTFTDYECILVNDGTKDNSQKIIDEYVKKDSRFKSIIKTNGGLSDARNAGMEIATSEYIYFLDSDDFLEPTMLEKAMNKIIDTDADMLIFEIYQYFIKTNTKEVISSHMDDTKEYTLASNPEMMTKILNAAWNKLYRKSLFINNDIHYPWGCYYEDLGTTYRLMLKANKIVFLNEPLYNYLADRPGNITQQFNFSVYHVLDMIKITCDYYKANGVYDKYYEELKYLAGINILECLKKTRNVDDEVMVNKFIDVCFFYIKNNWPEFPKCKYKICRQKHDWIYAHQGVLKFYLKTRKKWH